VKSGEKLKSLLSSANAQRRLSTASKMFKTTWTKVAWRAHAGLLRAHCQREFMSSAWCMAKGDRLNSAHHSSRLSLHLRKKKVETYRHVLSRDIVPSFYLLTTDVTAASSEVAGRHRRLCTGDNVILV